MPRRDDELPPLNPDGPPGPRLAPAWVPFAAAWLGVLTLLSSIVVPFLPGSRDPRAELEGRAAYSVADLLLPVPLYASVVAMFLGVVVLWQMRREPRPLPGPLVAQRAQSWVAIVLAGLGATVVYLYVALRGPRAGP